MLSAVKVIHTIIFIVNAKCREGDPYHNPEVGGTKRLYVIKF